MNCRSFRKFVGAFADGELEVTQNVEALEHLNMCPGCAQRVAAVGVLRSAVKNAYGVQKAPAGLHQRVRLALDNERIAAETPAILSRPGRRYPFLSRLTVSLGMAAAVAFAAGIWWSRAPTVPRAGTLTVVPGRAVADVREQHEKCVRASRRHHDESLGHDPDTIAAMLGRELNMTVLVPDLTPYGFDLIGADRCGIRGRPGAHVLYRGRSHGPILSVFSVARMTSLRSETIERRNGNDLLIAEDQPLCVVAWHDGPQTYVLSAQLPTRDMVELASHVRVAGMPDSVGLGARFAAALP